MPTASQAMIVMTDEGEDPRIPRRHYSSAAANISVASYDMDTAVKYSVSGYVHGKGNIPNIYSNHGTTKKIPNELTAKSYRGNMKYDTPSGNFRREVSAKDKYICSEKKSLTENRDGGDGENIKWVPRRERVELGRKQRESLPRLRMQGTEAQNSRDGVQGLQYRRRKLVPPKNISVVDKGRTGTQQILPRDAKFVPVPPGQTPKRVQSFLSTKENENRKSAGDMLPLRQEKRQEPKLSLLDEVKLSVNYDNRMQPAMHMRKKLPPSNPFAICFSLRDNDNYTHKDIKDILERQIALKVRSVQYDPVSIKSRISDVGSRWIVTYGTPAECEHAVSKGLEIGDDKIAVKLLNDVMKCEYEAYKIHLEDEQRNALNEVCQFSRQLKRSSKKRL